VAVIGLIDTGACGTCIDPAVLAPLELQPTGVVSIHTPSTGGSAVQVLQYDVDIFLVANPGQNSVRSFSTVPIIEAPLVGQGIQALIGRDILKDCLLIYDGQASSFTLGI
jgi:hypothetical protein